MNQHANLRGLRILYVAYPLLTVSQDSAGGAEQVLWTLEREMARCGAVTTVAASTGSRVAGELFPSGKPCRKLDDLERRDREHQEKVAAWARRRSRQGRPFDLVHDMSGGFWTRAAEINAPLLATLHLPRSFYPPQHFESIPANVTFNCVSQSQARSFKDLTVLAGVVANGIALDPFAPNLGSEERRGLLWLGRICEEKAPHLALDIAARTGLPLTLGGQVYPFSYHQKYYDSEVAPRLRALPNATFISLPSFDRKRQLLRRAQAVLITSQADETSSLVAMEAAASGTPAIVFARGAQPEIVRDGVTGFLIDGMEGAVRAIESVSEIDPAACVQHARDHFSSVTMAGAYARLYTHVLAGGSRPCTPSAPR